MSRLKLPESRKLTITAVRMPPRTKLMLEALSHQTGLSQMEHIRRALEKYFDVLEVAGKFNPHSRRPDDAPRMGRPPLSSPPLSILEGG
jgi:hypothetical protein